MATTGENQPPTEELKNLLLDEETGEQVSKNEREYSMFDHALHS